MELIYLYSKKEITFNRIKVFLDANEIKVIGLWDETKIEPDYSIKDVDEVVFSTKTKTEEGFTFLSEFLLRQITISVFKNAKNHEIMIFLDSLDYNQRDLIKKNLKTTFISDYLFQMIVFENDDDSNDVNWDCKFENFLANIGSVEFLGLKPDVLDM
ncbi:hypothetical protein [Flavobacterium polysaccharolyticum]|uniref:Uncharacterized protein n=1 Tax=Flavobacterium polysaccharolyticum TaxID=3133148 RepID=A0ABU9NUC7_9FLAO